MGLVDRRFVVRGIAAMPALMLASARAELPRPRQRLYGAAIRADRFFTSPAQQAAVIGGCDWITPEFDFNWNALEPSRGTWWFERADAIADFARAHDKPMRGHMLVWDQSTPDWAKAEMAERRDWRLVERWFDGALGRYTRDVVEWDVVNEAIDTEHGDRGLRRTCFQRAFGNGYVARAFRTAHAIAPQMPLMLNEYGLDYANPVERDRRRALIRLVERLRHDGVPIHGVGIQAHLDLAKGPLDTVGIAAMLREIADMGLSITITELDVMEADRGAALAVRDRAVADEMRRYLDVALSEPAVRGVTTWGLSDRDSWLLEQPGGTAVALNRGLPFDAAMRPKLAYHAVRQAMQQA